MSRCAKDDISGTSAVSPTRIPQGSLRFLRPDQPHFRLAGDYFEALLNRERHRATDMVMGALDNGLALSELYLNVFAPVQYEVGWLWQQGLISVGHEHYCTGTTQMIMAMLYPRLFRTKRGTRRLVAACVSGELHELGLRMLADYSVLKGWDSDFLGADTPVDGVLRMLEERPAAVLAISVTMHYHLEQAEDLIRAVRTSPRIAETIILVGGYSVRIVPSMWQSLGADGTADDAVAAMALAERLLVEREKK